MIANRSLIWWDSGLKVRQRAKIRNWYNQVPHLTQDTNAKVANSQLDITNESQDASSFLAGDHKATINRRAQKHNKHMTEIQRPNDPQNNYRLETVSKILTGGGGLKPVSRRQPHHLIRPIDKTRLHFLIILTYYFFSRCYVIAKYPKH